MTPSPDEKIELYNMTEEVLWTALDRYRSKMIKVKFIIFKLLLLAQTGAKEMQISVRSSVIR